MPTSDIEHWPRLTRFYGISPAELARTPNVITRVYIDALGKLEAEEQLSRMQASDFPHLTESARGKIHRGLMRAAGYGQGAEAPKVAPTAAGMAAVGLHIGVERESMSGKKATDA